MDSDLPVYVTEAFTSIQTQAELLISNTWPVLITIFGGMLLMKLFKKFGNRAT